VKVAFHPSRDGLLGCAASQHFGLLGKGLGIIWSVEDAGEGKLRARVAKKIFTPDSAFDICWVGSDLLALACGDGHVRIYSVGLENNNANKCLLDFHDHKKEACALTVSTSTLASGSWDHTCHLYDLHSGVRTRTLRGHTDTIHEVRFLDNNSKIIISASGDRSAVVWDLRMDGSAARTLAVRTRAEVLSMSTPPRDPTTILLGGGDGRIREYDIRKPLTVNHISSRMTHSAHNSKSIREWHVAREVLNAHDLGVRSLDIGGDGEALMLSASFDMSACVWDMSREDPMLARLDHHTEIVHGIGWSKIRKRRFASCSWDETVAIFDATRAFGFKEANL